MFTYQRTYGLHGSSLSENFHSSIKGGLRGEKVPLHVAPSYIRTNLSKRKLNVSGKRKLEQSVKTQLETCRRKGFDKFIEMAQCYLTEEGQSILYQQMLDALGYNVTTVEHADIRATYAETTWRGACHSRFGVIVTQVEKDGEGHFFRVQNKSDAEFVDLLYVNADGSFASTSPWDFQYGMPGRRTLAVFNSGAVAINLKLHFDPIYHVPYVNDILSEKGILDATAKPDTSVRSLLLPTVKASIDWAEDFTNEEWNKVVLGGEEMPLQMVRTTSSKNPDSKAESLKKLMQNLTTFAKYDETVHKQLVELQLSIEKKREDAARIKLEG